MYKMELFPVMVSTFSFMVTQISTQKYREVHLNVSSSKTAFSVIQHGFSLEEEQLLFAAKYCGDGIAFVWFKDHANQPLYYVAIHAEEAAVALQETGGPYVKRFILTQYALTCNVFEHYKLGWKNGYFALWRKYNFMWVLLMDWQDPTPNIGSVVDIHVASGYTFDGEWKLYIIEHTTVPFTTTCINF